MKGTRKDQYLRTYGARPFRQLSAKSLEGVELAVVIPALAEYSSLFSTLASISENPASDLRRTLVICVVNNHPYPFTSQEEIDNNQETLKVLSSLVLGYPSLPTLSHEKIRNELKKISDNGLRMAFIDASSAGNEIPELDGGVGTARKIGMDAVLDVIDENASTGVICCLDADTLVQKNYLSAVADHFAKSDDPGAVVAYSHQVPENGELANAICCYELFLRYYVLGLAYAGSPYAYHSIGSTMTCTVDGYCAVRGMNRRTAAEDFHFLNKLAKVGKLGVITETTLFPSARPSARVPFGTGRRIIRHLSGQTDEYRLYDYKIFSILKKWLELLDADPYRKTSHILADAHLIHPCLEKYLLVTHFDTAWPSIQKNSRDSVQLRRQFSVWFDGLKTLKFVHHLSHTAFPMLPMFHALPRLLDLIGLKHSLDPIQEGIPPINKQVEVLNAIRAYFPNS
jgi:hypothetical protein